MGNENSPYFLFAFFIFIVLRILVQTLNLFPAYNKIINIISSIVIVLYLAIRSRNQSKKVKTLLLLVVIYIGIILFTLYFGIIDIENINANFIFFMLGAPIVIVLLAIVYKTLNQIIQYYKCK
jgi:hypothetical protein